MNHRNERGSRSARTVPAPRVPVPAGEQKGLHVATLCHTCSASLTPPARRALRLRPLRPGWADAVSWSLRGPGGVQQNDEPRHRVHPKCIRTREAERGSTHPLLESHGARRRLAALRASCPDASPCLPLGRRQEETMFHTTNQTIVRKARRFQRPTARWSVALPRWKAAAATVGAVCLLSLQMRADRDRVGRSRDAQGPDVGGPVHRQDGNAQREDSS